MDIRKILKEFNVEEGVIEDLKEAITKDIGTEFVPRTQYNKKIKALDEIQEKYNDLEARQSSDEYKSKYETLEKEFNDYKTSIETEKTNASKSSTLREHLKAEGFNEKIINLLTKNFDLEKVEVEEGKIKGWEEMVKPMKEEYGDFISVEQQQGNPPANPPATNSAGGESNPLADALGKYL